jgi:HAD superfamily hydrolase (TIGR01509 family)
MNDWVAKLQSIYHIPTPLPELCIDMTQRMISLIEAGRVKAQPGAHEIVTWVHHHGIPTAIASSSPLTIIEASVAAHGWSNIFKVRASGEEVVNGKPSPDVYLLAAKRLNVDPTKCISFEDRLVLVYCV